MKLPERHLENIQEDYAEDEQPEILYLCDHKACVNCLYPHYCDHTSDIRHARNFVELCEGMFFEYREEQLNENDKEKNVEHNMDADVELQCNTCGHAHVCKNVDEYRKIMIAIKDAVGCSVPDWLAYRLVCRNYHVELPVIRSRLGDVEVVPS